MKVTTLGIWGAYPEANSSTSSFLLEEENFKLLIDAGSGVMSQLQRYISLEELDAIIISHYHHDHFSDIGCIQYGLMIKKKLNENNKIIPIYGHNKDQNKYNLLHMDGVTEEKVIEENKEINIGPFSVEFIETIHPVYGLAFKFKTNNKVIIYTADTEWKEDLVDFSKEADLIISEANLYKEQLNKVKGHLTGGEAGLLAKKASAKQLLLTHLPHFGDHNEILIDAKSNFAGNVLLAKPGKLIMI